MAGGIASYAVVHGPSGLTGFASALPDPWLQVAVLADAASMSMHYSRWSICSQPQSASHYHTKH
jgi:hypothetical protein